MQQFHPHPYQQAGIEAILEKSGVALWMEMGLGKTVVTLTAIDQLIYDRLEISRVLIVAPKKVAEATWQDEAKKWEHLQQLRISTVLGTEKQRKAALEAPADIYIINRENVPWLVHTLGRSWNFDMVVLDEASSFKNHAAQRFKALKAVRPRVHKVVELTARRGPTACWTSGPRSTCWIRASGWAGTSPTTARTTSGPPSTATSQRTVPPKRWRAASRTSS